MRTAVRGNVARHTSGGHHGRRRRPPLTALAPALVSALVLALAAGCTGGTPAQTAPDPLKPLLDAASADARTANAAAAVFADNSATLTVIGSVRAQQAAALAREVDRAAAVTADSATATPPTSAAPTDEGSVTAQLLQGLTDAQKQAAALLPSLPAYRAGLVASVAAGCASLTEALNSTPITAVTPTSATAAPAGDTLPSDVTDALQQALAAEHAALWWYGTASAFANGSAATEIIAAMGPVTSLRDATEHRLTAAGAAPKPAAPAYLAPQQVTGQSSALAVLAVAESDAATAWRAVLDRTTDPGVRTMALTALVDSAVRETRWRRLSGQSPASISLPGQPS